MVYLRIQPAKQIKACFFIFDVCILCREKSNKNLFSANDFCWRQKSSSLNVVLRKVYSDYKCGYCSNL